MLRSALIVVLVSSLAAGQELACDQQEPWHSMEMLFPNAIVAQGQTFLPTVQVNQGHPSITLQMDYCSEITINDESTLADPDRVEFGNFRWDHIMKRPGQFGNTIFELTRSPDPDVERIVGTISTTQSQLSPQIVRSTSVFDTSSLAAGEYLLGGTGYYALYFHESDGDFWSRHDLAFEQGFQLTVHSVPEPCANQLLFAAVCVLLLFFRQQITSR